MICSSQEKIGGKQYRESREITEFTNSNVDELVKGFDSEQTIGRIISRTRDGFTRVRLVWRTSSLILHDSDLQDHCEAIEHLFLNAT